MQKFLLLATAATFALAACGNETSQPADDMTDETGMTGPASTDTAGTGDVTFELASADHTQHLSHGVTASDDGSYVNVSGDFVEAMPGGNADGLVFMLTEEQVAMLDGKTATVTVNARGGDYKVTWSTRGSGNSGWNELAGSEDWTESSFTYDVPEQSDENRDVIGIVPALPDAPVEIASVTVTAAQ